MNRPHQPRPTTRETRQLLLQMIDARQRYGDYLRAVATGLRRDDPQEKIELKSRCDQTLRAWQSAHDAWHAATLPFPVRRRGTDF